MNLLFIVVPMIIIASGVVCFFVLPVPLPIRAAILGTDLLAAALVGFILWRRSH